MNPAVQAVCDAAQARTRAIFPAVAADWAGGILLCTILASSLAFIDGSVVNVGLPAIGADFTAHAGDLTWVINAYLLPLSALLLLGGAAGDRFGSGRLLIIGTGLFGIASVVCAFAPNFSWLLIGRSAQGVGAALLMPNSLAILGASFSGEARGHAIGLWAAIGAVMGAVGPVLGGWLIDHLGWRAIFFLNLPPALGAILLALLFVRQAPSDEDKTALDLSGGLLATAALGSITWALTIGTGAAGWTGGALGLLLTGILLLAAFLVVEKAKGDRAMMPLSIYSSSRFVGLSLFTWFLYAALGALMVLVPFVLIAAAGWSGTGAGAALTPFALIMAAISPLAGRVAGRIGPRWPLILGPLAVAAGFLLLLRLEADADYVTDILPGIVLIALGMSAAVAPLTTAVLSSVGAAHTGSVSGLNSALARTAGMIATALLGGVLNARGAVLLHGFAVAMIACAAAAVIASLSAFFLVRAGEGR
ncbi:MAG TPA: MFS transporter [Rhizomicrobium sp.]